MHSLLAQGVDIDGRDAHGNTALRLVSDIKATGPSMRVNFGHLVDQDAKKPQSPPALPYL